MPMLLQTIKDLSAQLGPSTVAHRRHLHAHPELSFAEWETAKYVEAELRKLGLEPQRLAKTGFVVDISGTKPGSDPASKVVALRADMDALPIEEANDVPYKSTVAGTMHACGHDAHTASLLGTASILQSVREHFGGTVRLLFQPGEEKLPGGATLMLAEGALKRPNLQSIIGQHVMPFLPAGTLGFREGMYMASTDELYVRVIGKGGHGAMPERCIDPVLIACHMIVALQSLVSRMASPKIPSVLSFGRVIANGITNVIPNEVYMEGTFRTLDEAWRAEAHTRILKMANGIAESMGGRCEFRIEKGYPHLKNDVEVTKRIRQRATEYVGAENIVELDQWMAAEDFAYYTHEAPGSFYRLGTGNVERGITSGVHTPTFDIDEAALEFSPGVMAWMAIGELEM